MRFLVVFNFGDGKIFWSTNAGENYKMTMIISRPLSGPKKFFSCHKRQTIPNILQSVETQSSQFLNFKQL